MGIDFYTTPASAPGRMVLLLAKHINVDMNVKEVDLQKGEQMKPEFLAINPQHTVPTMVDDGFVISESRAMLLYLQNKYGKNESLYPKDPQKRSLVEMRIFFDVSMLYPRFGEAYYPVMFGGQATADQDKVAKVDEMLGHVERFIKDGFAAGSELTIADFSMAACLSTIKGVHGLDKAPQANAYLEKCKGLMEGWEELNQKGSDIFASWYTAALEKQKA